MSIRADNPSGWGGLIRGARGNVFRAVVVSLVAGAAAAAGADVTPSDNAAAQPTPLADVTVTAPRPATAEELAGENVSNFVASHSKPAVLTGHLSRWSTGVCPSSQGLSPAFNDFVAARIRAVATSVGAPTQPAGQCKINVEIVFSTHPQMVLDQMVKGGHAWLLGFHYPHQTKRLATVNHPVQGWYVTATRGCHGEEVIDEAMPIGGAGSVPAGCLGSRLHDDRTTLIAAAFVIVDANKVAGMEIGSISDYLAVLTLTQAQPPDSCGGLPSIMDLMAPDCGREKSTSVTAGDVAYLRALYKTDLGQDIELEKSNIENDMRRQFKEW
jgi:hypothetical protein